MNMRKRDDQKRQLIEQAVLVITKEEGIQGLSFGKIAKHAQVSSGTPYVYFKDKTDMLSKMFLSIKNLFDANLTSDIDKGQTIADQIYLAVMHFARMYVNYPLEAVFLTAIRANPELIDENALRVGNESAKPLEQLVDRAIEQHALNITNLDYVTVLLFGPFIMLVQERLSAKQTVTLSELEAVVRNSVNGILKE